MMFNLYDFLIYCFISSYTPGANNLLSMNNAIKLGFRNSVKFNFGILAGFFVVMAMCAFFSATLFSYLPKIKLILQFAGATYMLYLAWKVWTSANNTNIENNKKASFISGMLLQFVNPKIYIYAITALSIYILPIYHSLESLILFTVILSLIGASGSFVWSLCGLAFCKVLASHAKTVNTIMMLLLVYCAASLFR